MMPSREEAGFKWWLRYVLVPLIGGGGVVAIIVAFMNRPTQTADSMTDYYWAQKFAQEKMRVIYGRCNDPDDEEQLQCNESSLGVRVIKAQKQLEGRLLEHKNVPELGYGYGTGHTVLISTDRSTLTWRGGRVCGDDLEVEMFVELYECVKR